jgi:TolA-binding protein
MLDSAYKYYSDIMVNYPATPYEGRINFAIGSYFLSMNDSVKADSIFNFIYNKYRNESIVNAAAIKLNKPLIDYDYDPAKKLYTEAESLMVKANYDSSITNMYKIYLTHHKSPYASRALYAMGWMLENKNMNDSAAAVYDTLAQEYPRSVYAADILPKITFYKDELARIQKAQKDSALIALTGIKADTLLSDSTRFKLQKLAGLTSDSTKKGTNIPGGNRKETADLTNPNAEKELFLKNATANPDTLVRIRGRGTRRQEK